MPQDIVNFLNLISDWENEEQDWQSRLEQADQELGYNSGFFEWTYEKGCAILDMFGY